MPPHRHGLSTRLSVVQILALCVQFVAALTCIALTNPPVAVMPVGAQLSRGDEPNVKEDGMRVSASAQIRKLSGGAVEEKEVKEEEEEEDLSAGGPVARRVLLEIAGFEKLSDEFFVVRDTTDGRGRGLFVAKPIAAETYLFDYLDSPAFIIDQVEFERRCESPTGTQSGDYAIGITLPDGVHVYLDAQDLLSSKHARFMNHAEHAPTRNCECWTITPPTIDHVRAMIFASRDLAVGEELCWDYGADYWRGREDKVDEARRPWWKLTWWTS